MRAIPTFNASGERIRDYSLRSIQALLEGGRIGVERSRKGVILRAYFLPTDDAQNPIRGRNPIVKKLRRGTYYSCLKSEGTMRLWQLHKVPTARDVEHKYGTAKTKSESELVERAVFNSVGRSVITRQPAQVIPTDSVKRRAPITTNLEVKKCTA
jgi:hypothetical protein